MNWIGQLKYDSNGLIPAIIQEESTGKVLMMAYMNKDSIEMTVKTGKTHFWSRSRNKFWMKGESSGHIQLVKSISFDCDADTLLIQVEQIGVACHEGYKTCF
ncbi:MAG TPA: phosphoribosyl-AMP cyclohydrolase, partial [Verrucomicrobiota bacterium]|nr:phosphoribosyl-AMP cyclohydrolase [Verrucomicrobiota bacterium]